MSAADQGTDHLTILRHPTNQLAKTWKSDGTIEQYGDAKYFVLFTQSVGDLAALSALLTELEANPNSCVIRGKYVGDEAAAARDQKEFKAGKVRRTLDYFDDQALHTVLLDVDKFMPTTVDPDGDPVGAVAEFIQTKLPASFQGAGHHVQISSSAGHPTKLGSGLRAHIWFWLETPCTSAELKRWAKAPAIEVDKSLFNVVQIHYTAAPQMAPGVIDPIQRRSWFTPGPSVALDIIVETPQPKAEALRQEGGRGQRLLELITKDPIAQHLQDSGMVKAMARDGALNIECPFSDGHTPGTDGETSTQYFPPHTGGFVLGAFKCMHESCSGRSRNEYLSKVGFDEALEVIKAVEEIALAAEAGDPGAPFEPAALATLAAYQEQDFSGWLRLRERLKKAKVSVTKLDDELNKQDHGGDGAAFEEVVSVADKLITLARGRCRFLHDEQQEPYAVFESAGARHVSAIQSNAFADYLSHAYYSQHDRAPSEAALKAALSTLRGQALFKGDTAKVFTRVAKTETGYWLDLCNDAWQCIHVTDTSWEVKAGAAVPLFTRSKSMRALPTPVRGGTMDALWPLVNVPEAERLMLLAWLLECLRPDTPHCVLELVGEQGSAKSSTQRALRRLIDPNQSDLRSAPKTVEEVWIAARNSHMVSLENLSHLQGPYQDALCVLATGGGYASRTLYTNLEETIIELRKPIMLNGISVIVTAQDLLDRCLHIDLPQVQNRELAGEIEARFEAAQPQLLGALLDMFVSALRTLPDVSIAPQDRPRMADFAALGEAVFRIHGEGPGEFLRRYQVMRQDGVMRTIESSPVGAALIRYLSQTPNGFDGQLSALFEVLNDPWPGRAEGLPRSAKGLGDALRRLSPALRQIGYVCESTPKKGGVIRWRISSGLKQPVQEAESSEESLIINGIL